MPPAARLTDMHTCPMQTPGVPPIPHVGGPVIGPGVPGPPDSIVKGSATVTIGGKPAARMGDTTAHGGQIVLGCPNVMIGG